MGLNHLGVHFVRLVWVGPQQASVSFFIDEQVGVVHLKQHWHLILTILSLLE